MSIGICKRNFG